MPIPNIPFEATFEAAGYMTPSARAWRIACESSGSMPCLLSLLLGSGSGQTDDDFGGLALRIRNRGEGSAIGRATGYARHWNRGLVVA